MRVLFLDFDGVLNSHQSAVFWHHFRNKFNEFYVDGVEFCPIAVSNLEELLRRVPDLKIVISSSWRLGETIDTINGKFFKNSDLIQSRIIGITESFSQTRGDEIEKYLTEHTEIIDYVILDDDRDMLYNQRNNFINTSALHGFTYGDMLQALRILGEGVVHG